MGSKHPLNGGTCNLTAKSTLLDILDEELELPQALARQLDYLLLPGCPGAGKGRRAPLDVKLEGDSTMCMSCHVCGKLLNKFIKSNYPLI